MHEVGKWTKNKCGQNESDAESRRRLRRWNEGYLECFSRPQSDEWVDGHRRDHLRMQNPLAACVIRITNNQWTLCVTEFHGKENDHTADFQCVLGNGGLRLERWFIIEDLK